MSRHRNVRSMNYSDEYDGYDDVYGHSVEDEYCISPSDEAQFMYDRTRQPQISAFFSEQDNITEEDESLQHTDDRKNSDCFIQPTLSDLEEAKLRSCLEEIRNVIGDSIPERVLVETVLKCDFNINKSLDTVLSNATSSNEIISEDPKPQRVRRERDRDFINFQSNLPCLVNHSDVKQLSETINAFESQEFKQETCHSVSLLKKSEEDVCNKLTANQNHTSSSSFIPELCGRRQSSRITYTNLSSNYSSSLTSSIIPSSFSSHSVVKDSNQIEKDILRVQVDDSLQIDATNSYVRIDSCSKFQTLKSEGNSCGKMAEQKSSPLNKDAKPLVILPGETNMLSSSDEEFGASPLSLLAKQLLSAGGRRQELEKPNLPPRSPTEEEEEEEEERNSHDQCKAFRNLSIQESSLPPESFCERSKGVSDILRVVNERKGQADSDSSHETDNSDDEKSNFSPLAALANRHRQHKSAESCLSKEKKERDISSRLKQEASEVDKKSLSKILGPNISEAGSSRRSKERSLSACASQGDFMLIDKSSDDENTFSPLAALADKFNKGKGEGSSRSDLSSSSSVASGLEQKCTHVSSGFSSGCLISGSEEAQGKITKILCRCKSESDGYPSSSPSYDSICVKVGSGTIYKGQHLPQDASLHCDSEPVCDDAFFPSAVSRSGENEPQEKSASSLSDLAFFHLTRSASCGMKSEHDLANKRIQSDTGISKSVPGGGFVIPFLKQEGCVNAMWKNSATQSQEENVDFDRNAVESSDDDWVIDLSNAIRDPGLRLSDNIAVVEDKLPAQIIDVGNIEEVQEINAIAPCELDASGLLKMKFSCTRRRCSSFGKVLCRQWRELAQPYIPPSKLNTGTIVHFNFEKSSPDDIVLACRNTKN